MAPVVTEAATARELQKTPTGIRGLDEITGGGLPHGRPTLICGNAGCGKTLLSAQFLVAGATRYGEPGVFMSFEETARDLIENVRSLGYDLERLIEEKKLRIDHVRVERSEIEETGEYDLEGLFVRLGHAIDTIGAKRVVLDTIEALFGGLSNEGVLRAELRRLFGWLKERGVTAVITAERGAASGITRHGLEEYVSDCVILLDHRVNEQLATRRLRIVKYRGSQHGTNEYPFLIDERGIEVMPVTSVGLDHPVSTERVSTGVTELDGMLEGAGVYRGSTTMVSGGAGTGKTTLSAHFVDAACRRGERALFCAFEESQDQIVRNMTAAGVRLTPHLESGLLRFQCRRPTYLGLEAHLVAMLKEVREFGPSCVVVDPISSLLEGGTDRDVKVMSMRLVDALKSQQITGFFTSLTSAGGPAESSEIGLSSLIDTWLLVREIENGGERNRGLYVLKSRGIAHSNQVREFSITSDGIRLHDVYVGPDGMFIGSFRLAAEARDREAAQRRRQEVELKRRQLERGRRAFEAKLAMMRLRQEAIEESLQRQIDEEMLREAQRAEDLDRLAERRGARAGSGNGRGESRGEGSAQ